MRLLSVCLVVSVLATACGSTGSTDSGVTDNTRTGNTAVYDRIDAMTDCTELQEQFDIAMDNADAREPGDPHRDLSLSYARAADNRMSELGCYR